ncbi:polysaccharide biosynthesis protein [Paenibacillus sacheonensis]|nr:polysaccharide biosynthesis protein [Paenibacillus sacheonensis]MBM7569314.1 O-antigen/teichoic acid export membrane protein [Paenibacillus sacheonensis]
MKQKQQERAVAGKGAGRTTFRGEADALATGESYAAMSGARAELAEAHGSEAGEAQPDRGYTVPDGEAAAGRPFAKRRGGGQSGDGPRFMKGAALMGAAMAVSKTLGTLQKIPLQNIAGDRVFGIYNAVYPIYQLLLVMVTAGFPVAVSLLVAERDTAGDQEGSARVLRASVWLLTAGGIAGFLLLWTGSSQVAGWLGDSAAAPAVRASALAFWVAPAMAAFRGYYQGRGRMLPSAVSQLSEQTVRVAGMLALLLLGWYYGWADDRLAAGATAGSAIGGTAGLAVIAGYWLREERRTSGAAGGTGRVLSPERGQASGQGRMAADGPGHAGDQAGAIAEEERPAWAHDPAIRINGVPAGEHRRNQERQAPIKGSLVRVEAAGKHEAGEGTSGQSKAIRDNRVLETTERYSVQPDVERPSLLALMRRLARLAVPVTLGALAVPALNVVDAFTVPRLLHGTGLGQDEAMTLFGLYSRGQPLVQLVVMIAGAVGGAFVPALARSRASGDAAAVRQQGGLILRAAWGVGAAAVLGLVLLAEPIDIMLYADAAGTRTFALVGCTALAGTVSALAAAVLQGLGAVRTPALLMLAAAGLKAALNAALVPAFGTAGAACAGIAALTAAALLGSAAARRACGAAVPARSAAGMGLALAVMAAVLVLAERGGAPLLGLVLPPRAAAAALALGGTALGGALFAAAVLRFGGISARELRALPGGDALAARLARWRLLPKGA